MVHTALRSTDVSRWPRRVPTLVLTAGPAASLAIVLWTSRNEPGGYGTIDEVTTWSFFSDSVFLGMVFAIALSAWFAPRLSCAVFALLLQPWMAEPIDHALFRALYWTWPAILVVDLMLVMRQRALAGWSAGSEGSHGTIEVLDTPVLRYLVSSLLCFGAIAASVVWSGHRDDLVALGQRAERSTGVVVAQDTAFDTVDMRVDGETYEFFVEDASTMPVGSEQLVMVDPRGEHRPYTNDDADPDGWGDLGAPVGAGLWTAFLIGALPTLRRRRLEQLANDDPEWVRARIREHPLGTGWEVFALDDTAAREPLVLLPAIEPCFDPPVEEPIPWRERWRSWVAVVRHGIGASPGDSAEPFDHEWWLDDELDGDDDDIEPDPDFLSPTEVDIAGLQSDGSLCLIRVSSPDGHDVFANVRPARDRWTLRWLALAPFSRLFSRSGAEAPATAGTPPHEHREETFIVERLIRVTSRVGPVFLGIAGFAVTRLVLGGEPATWDDAPLLTLPVAVGWLAGQWWSWSVPPLRLNRYGLRITDTFWDRIIPAGEIKDVRRLQRSVTIELVDGSTAAIVDWNDRPDRELQALMDEVAVIAGRAYASRHEAVAWPAGVPRYLPSPTIAVAALAAVMTTLPVLL